MLSSRKETGSQNTMAVQRFCGSSEGRARLTQPALLTVEGSHGGERLLVPRLNEAGVQWPGCIEFSHTSKEHRNHCLSKVTIREGWPGVDRGQAELAGLPPRSRRQGCTSATW